VAESLGDFDDALVHHYPASRQERGGRRLGALSNAGFECVAVADNLGGLELASFSEGTKRRLGESFAKAA